MSFSLLTFSLQQARAPIFLAVDCPNFSLIYIFDGYLSVANKVMNSSTRFY